MPSGTCDPASRGAQWNEGELAVEGGLVTITYRYGWDGVSTMPHCVGDLNRIVARNQSPRIYYAHFQGRKGTWLRVQLDPGATQTYRQPQLGLAGFVLNTDLDGLHITTDPNPPVG